MPEGESAQRKDAADFMEATTRRRGAPYDELSAVRTRGASMGTLLAAGRRWGLWEPHRALPSLAAPTQAILSLSKTPGIPRELPPGADRRQESYSGAVRRRRTPPTDPSRKGTAGLPRGGALGHWGRRGARDAAGAQEPGMNIFSPKHMGNVVSSVTHRKRAAKKRNAKNDAVRPKITVNSKACTYNAASNHWQCVHRRASTVNNMNSNSWNGFWVDDMPYSLNNNDNNNNNGKKVKKRKKQKKP